MPTIGLEHDDQVATLPKINPPADWTPLPTTLPDPAPYPYASGGGGGGRDAAFNQYRDYLGSIGGRLNAETENDFENLWRQSAENSVYAGQGLDNARSFAENLEGLKPRLVQRWQGEQGQDAYDDSGRYYPQSGQPNTRGGSSQGSGPRVSSGNEQFTDPITSLIEAAARARVDRLENPPADSGQALLENMLRKVAAQFESGGYTPAEQEIFQTRAMEPLEQLRAARKQQVLHQLSQRNIDPQSGVGRSMLADVDRQFDAMRSQTQRELASTEATERTNRILQALGLTGQLAGAEEGRLDKAFEYRGVPLNLADRSFNQAMSLYGQNNPLSLVNPLIQLSQQQQGRNDTSMAGLADLLWLLTQGGAA